MPRTNCRSVRLLIAALLAISSAAAWAQTPPTPVEFVGIGSDAELEHNDRELCRFLEKNAAITCVRNDRRLTLKAAIDRVVALSKDGKAFMARLTPYALVVAELRGARFDVLATYDRNAPHSAVEQTYHSYFIVRRSDFQQEPDLAAIIDYLKESRRRFAYHDRFSTSSYFVPLLLFKEHNIRDTDSGGKIGEIHPIDVQLPAKADSALTSIEKVQRGAADIAAVWDGTLAKFDEQQTRPDLEEHQKVLVWRVRINRTLPNDLIVASKGVPSLASVRAAIEKLPDACAQKSVEFQGDVVCWRDLRDANGAWNALTALRQDAAPEAPRMTVRIEAEGNDPRLQKYVAAAEHAVRFARTEFAVLDDGRLTPDVHWKLELVRDGALLITSTIDGIEEVGEQTFRISFTDENDLPQRIESRVHSELARIRYVWPYGDEPIVLRDVNFTMPEQSRVIVQKVIWKSRHEFEVDKTLPPFKVSEADMSTFTLSSMHAQNELELEPMSNVAYRAVLVPPRPVHPLFKALTVAALVLFVAALIAALLDTLRAMRARPQPAAAAAGEVIAAPAE